MSANETPPRAGPTFDEIGQVALTSYLSGQQDGQQWALLDNLTGDDLRDVAKAAIVMLRNANPAIALASLALDGMTPRAQRFAAREAALAFIDPYLESLSERLGGVVTAPAPSGDQP